MKEGVLFEITRDSLETGLRGMPVGYCTTSEVDPIEGLSYVGHPIQELAHLAPIEVIYLLYYGVRAAQEEKSRFEQELIHRAQCNSKTIQAIERLPSEGSAMDLFAAALLIAGIFEGLGGKSEAHYGAFAGSNL